MYCIFCIVCIVCTVKYSTYAFIIHGGGNLLELYLCIIHTYKIMHSLHKFISFDLKEKLFI